MVSPVTGPFSTHVQQNGPPNDLGQRTIWYTWDKTWRKQRKPYNLPLAFLYDVRLIDSFTYTNSGATLSQAQCWCLNDTDWAAELGPASIASFNKARLQFINNLKPAQAELGAAAAEWRKSVEAIAHRGKQFYDGVRAIRRFRFGDASRIFGLSKPVKPRSKQFADNLLEFRFGWAPLAGDIGNALQTLVGGLPSFKVHGRGLVQGTGGTRSGSLPGTRTTLDYQFSSGHVISARVRATNPNLALANQLGLINPAYVAWEVVPFSFVLDYFVNVGEFLNGFTDLVGYDLADVNWTWRAKASSQNFVAWTTGTPPSRTDHAEWSAHRVKLQRDVGPLPGTKLAVRWPWRVSPIRAATSIALLVQQLHGRKP